MAETEVNIPLLRKIVEWVEEQGDLPYHLSEWDQQMWVKDSACRRYEIKIAARDYDETKDPWDYDYWEERLAKSVGHESDCGTSYCAAGRIASWHDPDYLTTARPEDKPHADTFAAQLLGVDSRDATALFGANNTPETFRQIAEEIAGERL
jgi:hypothetical protein